MHTNNKSCLIIFPLEGRINAYPELARVDKNRMKFVNVIDDYTIHSVYTGKQPHHVPNIFMCDIDGLDYEADKKAIKTMNKISALQQFTKIPITSVRMFTGSGNHVYGIFPLMKQELRDLISRQEMGISMYPIPCYCSTCKKPMGFYFKTGSGRWDGTPANVYCMKCGKEIEDSRGNDPLA